MATISSRVGALEKDMQQLKNDLATMQTAFEGFADIGEDIHALKISANNILKWIKRGLPLVTTAAVTSGIVSGKWGAFFNALLHT